MNAGTTSGGLLNFRMKRDVACDAARYQTALYALEYVELLVKDGVNPLEAIQGWKAVYEELRDEAEENLRKQGEM